MKTWIVAAVGCAVGVVGCFGQVSQGSGGSGGPTPDPSGTTTSPSPQPGVNWPNTPPSPPEPQLNAADAGDAAIAICVSDSGFVCNLPDGTACFGNGDCSSGLCYGDEATSGHCSEECTPGNEAIVCNFGAHKCGSAGFCLST